jgi:magnesium chelatase subunit I
VGPRGTGKTTAARSLVDLLPEIYRSTCFYGCTPEDVTAGGMDAICPECAKKFGEGIPLTRPDRVKFVELPLNAKLEDVIGGLDERALVHERMRLKRGILAQADQNILYIDEVNLLNDEIIDAILDAASQGSYTVRRGPTSATYRSRFTLIGSMNPEEGNLRPQIMDRFGLRVVVRGLQDSVERMEVYHRVSLYRKSSRSLIRNFSEETSLAQQEIQAARSFLPGVEVPDDLASRAIRLIQDLKIDSSRAEITLLEAARAYAAAAGRIRIEPQDIRVVAPMTLRLRRSSFMRHYFEDQAIEEQELAATVQTIEN